MKESTSPPAPRERTLMVLVWLACHVTPFAPPLWGSIGLGAVVTVTLSTRSWSVLPSAVLFFLMELYWLAAPDRLKGLPSLPFLLPFLVTALVVSFAPGPGAWMRAGKIDRTAAWLVGATSLVSAVALLLWALSTDHLGASVTMVEPFRGLARWKIFCLAIPIFALVNAFAEEVVYRGVLQEGLRATLGQGLLILLLQADAFAMAHFKGGFPNGYWGYAMVLVYGTMLGYLRSRTRGMLAPYVAHVTADLVIVCFLFWKLL